MKARLRDAMAALPAIVAVLEVEDHGPSDGEGSASCPHCGARGRYVLRFLCADGTRRGAMRGCVKLFPEANTLTARLTAEALKRLHEARDGRKLASWWAEILEALEATSAGKSTVADLDRVVVLAEQRRQSFLRSKGFGRYGRRLH